MHVYFEKIKPEEISVEEQRKLANSFNYVASTLILRGERPSYKQIVDYAACLETFGFIPLKYEELEDFLLEIQKTNPEKFEEYVEKAFRIDYASYKLAGGIAETEKQNIPEKFEVSLPYERPRKKARKWLSCLALAGICSALAFAGYAESFKKQPQCRLGEGAFSYELKQCFINYLQTIDRPYRKALVEFYGEKNWYPDREREYIMLDTVISSLPKEEEVIKEFNDYLNSLDKEAREKMLSLFASDGKISLKEYEQLKFLESLPKEEQLRAIKEGKAHDFDWDKDNMSNYFEKFVFKLADPFVPNDRYAIYIFNSGGKFASHFEPTLQIKKVLVERYKFNPENIYAIYEATPNDFKNVIEKVAEKADENDFVYIFIEAHGGRTSLFLPSENAPLYLKYSTLDKWLEKLDEKVKAETIFVSACFSGKGAKRIAGDKRVVIASCDEKGGPIYGETLLVSDGRILGSHFFTFLTTEKRIYPSIQDLYKYFTTNSPCPTPPRLFDVSGLSDKIYLGESKDDFLKFLDYVYYKLESNDSFELEEITVMI